jgi:hypothetical protein
MVALLPPPPSPDAHARTQVRRAHGNRRMGPGHRRSHAGVCAGPPARSLACARSCARARAHVPMRARTQVYAAVAPEVVASGSYFVPIARADRPPVHASSHSLQAQLWAFTERLIAESGQ